MELQPTENKVSVWIGFHYVAPRTCCVLHHRKRIAKRHLVASQQAVGVGVPLHVQVDHTFVLTHHLKSVAHIAADVEVQLTLSPSCPQVSDVDISSIAKLVRVKLHALESKIPGSYII